MCTKAGMHVYHPGLDHDPSCFKVHDPSKKPFREKSWVSFYHCPKQAKQGLYFFTPVELRMFPHLGRW